MTSDLQGGKMHKDSFPLFMYIIFGMFVQLCVFLSLISFSLPFKLVRFQTFT